MNAGCERAAAPEFNRERAAQKLNFILSNGSVYILNLSFLI